MADRTRPPADRLGVGYLLDQIRITRRRAVQLLAATAWGVTDAAAQQTRALSSQPTLEPIPNLEPLITIVPKTPAIYLLRRVDDMLLLDVELQNLKIVGTGTNRRMARVQANQPSRLIVRHPPQAIADQAFQQVSDQGGASYAVDSKGNKISPPPAVPPGPEPLPLPPNVAQARISGISRVVFLMPSGTNDAPFSLSGVLDATRTWPLVLDPLARPAPQDLILQLQVDQPIYRIQNPKFKRTQASLEESQGRLERLAMALGARLPAMQQEALAVIIPTAAPKIADEITQAARSGRSLSDAEVDRLVSRELDAGLKGLDIAPSSNERQASARVLEAAAAGTAIATEQSRASDRTVVRTAQNTPTRTAPSAPTRTTPSAPARTAPTAQPQLSPNLEAALIQLKPRPPLDTATAIELPYRLIISPLATAGFTHATGTVSHGPRTELWHTRLGTRGANGVDDQSHEPIRAIWSPDYGAPVPTPGTDWALDGTDRNYLVKLMAGYDEKTTTNAAYTPRPATSKRLMLTALGGWLDADGAWPVATLPKNVDLVGWNHRTALARDYYVRVIYAGFLFPFGHAASLIKITERKFERYPGGKGRVAAFRQRFFIIVRERLRNYPGSFQAHLGRDFPFKRVEVLTKITPDLLKPGEGGANNHLDNTFYDPNPALAQELYREAFFPVLSATKDFLFDLVGVDGAGRRIPFSAPLMFVSIKHNNAAKIGTPTAPKTVSQKYSSAGSRATVPMNGATILYAPQGEGASADADTNVPTDTITFRGVPPTSGSSSNANPFFFPGVARAAVKLAAVKQLLGTSGNPQVEFSSIYLQNGFDAPGTAPAQLKNKGQLFLNLVTAAPLAALGEGNPSDKFGGMIQPDIKPSALSRKFGMVSGASNAAAFAGGNFNPLDFLPDAKLFGVIKLTDILGALLDFISDETKAPKFTNLELPDRVEATYKISQGGLKKDPLDLFLPSSGSVLEINSKVVAKRDGSAPEASVDGSINDFKVNLFGFIIIAFDLLGFHSKPGKKPDVDVGIKAQDGILFGGPLEFVNTLKDLIPTNGFSDPVPISISPTGVSAQYTLGLPTVAVGICSLQNISFGAGFNLPFTGQPPSVRFNFAERQNPFTVTVSLFGGGGFVAITIDTGGMRELEAALEFGASISIDLGVASGGVYVKGGFYFHWKEQPDKLIYFEGYVEMGGHLSVLCIITVSLVFHLALAYEKTGGKTRLFGQASLTVEIEILFFSVSVSVKVERQFAGSNGDPSFAQLIDQSAWTKYCAAFA